MPTIINANCLDALRNMPDNSVDAAITDPPYGLSNTTPQHVAETMREWANGNTEYVPPVSGGFMGQAWDSFVPPPAVWAECHRVLKPGGHLATFAGTRTLGIMDMSVRLAGFDHRDTIGAGLMAWVSGQGFPKSLNVAKATGNPEHEGLGTALKPSWEPILLYRKPLAEKTVAANVTTWGTGAINIDACRIATTDKLGGGQASGSFTGKHEGWDRPYMHTEVGVARAAERAKARQAKAEAQGRFPANVVLDEHAAHELDQQSGTSKGRVGMTQHSSANAIYGKFTPSEHSTKTDGTPDEGGASRFFYVAKAPKRERPNVDGVQHPTVKPLALMRWLVRLLTPPGGVVLDPFAGSGTTVEAAMLEGFHPVGIEAHEPYIALIEQRIQRATAA